MSLKDRILIHHTEKDLIKVSIVRGKDHHHLELKEGDETFHETKHTELSEAISKGIEFLKKFYNTEKVNR